MVDKPKAHPSILLMDAPLAYPPCFYLQVNLITFPLTRSADIFFGLSGLGFKCQTLNPSAFGGYKMLFLESETRHQNPVLLVRSPAHVNFFPERPDIQHGRFVGTCQPE